MSERKRIAINRGFVMGYAAIAVLALLTGFVTNYSSSLQIGADTVGDGSSCLTGTSVQSVSVTTAEREIFGNNVAAYSIQTKQKKNLKLLVGVEEQSAVGNGGIVTITAGIQNLGDKTYTDKDGKILLKYTDGSTNKTLQFKYGNPNLATGQYWYKASQTSISDYGINIQAELRNGSGNHLQACVSKVISLEAAITGEDNTDTESDYAGDGSSCQTGSTVKTIAVTSAEKALFGDSVVAYQVETDQNKNLKVLVGAKESSAVGDGGVVTLTAGIQNLDDKDYSDKKGRIYLKFTNGSTNKKLQYYYGETKLSQGQYWYKTVQTSMTDYNSSMTLELRNGSDEHLQACISNAISVDKAVVEENGGTSTSENPYISSISVYGGGADDSAVSVGDSIKIGFSEAIDPNSINGSLELGGDVTGLSSSETGGVSVSSSGIVTIKNIATFDTGTVSSSGSFTVKAALNSTGKRLTITLTAGNSVAITDEDFSSATQTGGTVEDNDGNAMQADSSINDPSGSFGSSSESDLTYSVLNGYNAVSTDVAVSTEAFLDAGMTVFDYNWNGDKKWRSTSSGDEIDVMYPGVGYYVYNPSSDEDVTVSTVSSASDIYSAKKGWNLLHSESGGTLDEVDVNVLNSGESLSCHTSDCVTEKTLYDLFEGTASTRNAYSKMYLIVDGNSDDASTAFDVIEVTEDNIDSIEIPENSTYWVYLFDL